MCGEKLAQNHVHFCNHSQICKSAPVHRDGPNIYSTCGTACASKLPPPNTNEPRSSEPPNSAFMSSGLPRNNADTTRSHSRPNQIGMCDVSFRLMIPTPSEIYLSHARYVTSALDIKEETKSTLLVDSAALLN